VGLLLAYCSLRIGISTLNLILIKESFIDISPQHLLLLPPIQNILVMSGQWRFVVKYDILEYLLLLRHPVAEHPLTGLLLTLSGRCIIAVADLSSANQVGFHGLCEHIEVLS
jgi:hypothetical protein